MSKRKTVLKFAIAAVLLGGSSTVAVLYFPYAALAIKFGIVASTAPLAIFAISAMVALASAITLGVLAVSAMCSKGKSNEISGEPRSKNKEEGQNLVQEEEQAVPTPTSPLLPQEPEELVTPAQQQPVGDSAKGTEMPQHEEEVNFVDNGDSAEQQAEQTDGSLPSLPPYQEQTSPMNNMRRSESFPSLPSIVVDGHNGSGNSSRVVRKRAPQNEERVFFQDEEPSLSSSISSLYGSHYSTSSDPSSSSGGTSSLSSTFSSLTSEDWDMSHSTRAKILEKVRADELREYGPGNASNPQGGNQPQQFPSLPMAAKLKAALAEREQQHNQTNSEEREWVDRNTGSVIRLDSHDGNWMDNHFDSFGGSSCYDSIAPNPMTRSFMEQSQGEGLPLITEEGESVSASLQELRVNQRSELEENYPGFAINSNGTRLY